MSRIKSQEELEREQADALFAQQLVEQERAELQRQQTASQQRAPAHTSGYNTTSGYPPAPMSANPSAHQVMCPTCMSLNNINPANMHLQHMCGTCRRVLPNRGEQLQTARTATLPSQQYSAPPQAPAAPPQPSTQMLRCQQCRADNIVPASGGAFRCGHCQTPLQSTMHSSPAQGTPTANPPAPQTASINSTAPAPQAQPNRPVLQAQAVDVPRQLEVRCGRCPAVNNVPEDPRTPGVIQFKCGSCGSLNRANY
jgi:hypothetical protein